MEYKNDAKYTLSDYANMCLKTAILERKYLDKTFGELVESKENMTHEEAVKDIYEPATKLNEDVNKELELDGDWYG